MKKEELFTIAKTGLAYCYAPYSDFKVSAVLESENGIYTGVNIENASFGATMCAERTAFFKALSEGETKFKQILIIGGRNGQISDFCLPCGICRQVMAEFCDGDFKIITAKSESEFKEYSLGELMPEAFGEMK